MKHSKNVTLPDLILIATVKYLIDFYDLPKEYIHVVTLDKPLWQGVKKVPELPNAYDPAQLSDVASRVFE